MTYTLESATPDDFEFLRDLHHTVMRTYVEAIWGWDDEQQDGFVRRELEEHDPKIVWVDGQRVGQLTVVPKGEGLHLLNIFVAPESQGHGIGTALISDVLQEADSSSLPVSLRVFKLNPAKRLYDRLGFATEREDESSYYMQREPLD